ncbi:unnamed protein product [Cyberlindnera jadinii]|uniref:Zn(2)-C6 fungal-type domain-containing protein n=1 Tax=Cyberlindnera jadinii (strain ATCC 18201 / CBS 1600 / BCRC 20928 / JCM 3617 / NBRC 0987 / NRRL Y-1542) TaxID=983966 RepID=A0A0H5CCA7_CYBJN|nr:hypothetical protein CYBJADRAFT_168284 [Cyberlindnera jadinii NRRL Y-1542]ODV72746.1 hypothetical protein CYBJADRAFT_168284 [Cyberlindnera jadinii NRRL Y-1542]CEP22229.1 unnamed protein product [Cyberlindnera jadinii]
MSSRVRKRKSSAGVSRRQKIILSCAECRRRKIKCDHGKPVCQNCITKGSQESCSYSKSPWIDIIVAEKKLYEDIDALKKENDDLVAEVNDLNRTVIMFFKKKHNLENERDAHSQARTANRQTGSLEASPSGSSSHTPSATEGLPRLVIKDYHFLKDSIETPLRNRTNQILKLDFTDITAQVYSSVEYPRLMTYFRCPSDPAVKQLFLSNVVSKLPDLRDVEEYLNYYFTTNFHRYLPLLSKPLLLKSFHSLFNIHTRTIELDELKEKDCFVELSIILLVLKIVSLYKRTPLEDPEQDLLRSSYISAELGEIETRASFTVLQATLMITTFRMFSHKVSDLELSYCIAKCRDLAITLGLHKNTEVIYELRDPEERKVLHDIKELLDRGY